MWERVKRRKSHQKKSLSETANVQERSTMEKTAFPVRMISKEVKQMKTRHQGYS